MSEIAPVDFVVKPHYLWDQRSLLLTSGDFTAGKYNTMTVGWGSFGTMWARPFAQIVVRPSRYTFEFMQSYPTFTLCAFAPRFHDALTLLGTTSGRYADKIADAGLTPVAATIAAAPAFAEAELVIECRKLYWDDLEPSHFLEPKIEDNYDKRDYHRIYFGEILAVRGIDSYRG
ncbi:MAG: flavin reductase [Coriobacteriia bacterium]